MKIHVTSCEVSPGAWRHQEEVLRDLWAQSDHRHELVEAPDDADIIIIGNIRDENFQASLRQHPVICRNPSKCFGLSDADEPVPLLQGVYTSAHKALRFKARYRSGAYNLYHPDFKNPFVMQHGGDAFLKPKRYLCSFVGRNCHPVRSDLFKKFQGREDMLIEDTSSFNLFTHANDGKREWQRKFVTQVEESKFALCPRGNGTASIRLFEVMRMGVAPVIASDDWILPEGPDWAKFSIIIKEAEIRNLDEILKAHESRYRELGTEAAKAYQTFFSDGNYFNYLVEQCVEISARRLVSERIFWSLRNVFVFKMRLENKCRRMLRRH